MQILPMFPLQLVVYPGEKLNLHIFEMRYRQLINEVEVSGNTFGVPAFISNQVMNFGTEVELLEISKKYDDGKMDVKTRGVGIFKIHEFFPKGQNKLYATAEIEKMEFESEGDIFVAAEILDKTEQLYKMLKINKPLPENPKDLNIYSIAHDIGMSLSQEYELLSLPEEKTRQDFVLKHLNRLLPTVSKIEEIRRKAKLNGHFKNIIPPKF